ncbi:MAG: protein translocase subunit SecD [Bacilli bacterium]|nr:protein translocase subunit SecD [Bacilli bacterium]
MDSIVIILICIAAGYLIPSLTMFMLFKKGEVKRFLAWIPVINYIYLLKMVDLKWYHIFEYIFSIGVCLLIYLLKLKGMNTNIIFAFSALLFMLYYIRLNIRLAKKFNKGILWYILLNILPVISHIILAIKGKYNSNVEFNNSKVDFSYLFVTVLGIVVSATVLIPTVFDNITKGLDLAGGFEILYQISPSEKGAKLTSTDVNDTYRTMLRRIDKLGVSEPELTIEGKDKIRVKLAGVTDAEAARDYITVAGELTFRDSSDNKLMDKSVLSNGTAAKVSTDDQGRPAVLLNIKDKDLFYEVTTKISQSDDKLIVIWLDYVAGEDSYKTAKCGSFENLNDAKCLSAATVSQGFSSNVIIQGNFTEEQVKDLVDLINSGSNNVKFKEISSQTVGSAFGENSLLKTELAGIIGIVLIILFMTFRYRFSGFIASAVILIYTFMTFLVFYLIEGVLTLPGIAALVLGIGMAVDANVITSERIKEELRKGRDLKTAYRNGIKNSFSSILDSNVTTFIIAIILFIFGESSVKGFATMLIINIIMTMLIVVLITRMITYSFIKTGFFNNKLRMFINQKRSEIKNSLEEVESKFESRIHKDYVGNFKKFILVPIVLVIISLVFVFINKGFNFGIDFTGGTDITISNAKNASVKSINKDIKDLGFTIISSEKDNDAYYVKVSEILDKDEIKKTNGVICEKYDAKTDISVVSNLVKKDLIKNAIIALIYAIIGIILYITIRYKFSYALSSIIALIHDSIMIVALFAIMHLEINSIFIAAILTIIGYSINNTIVIFDRIRENKNKKINDVLSKDELKEIANKSIKETMLRSINTTITTMLPIICLIIFGSKEILEFDIAILIGLIAGAYSSILISGSLWVILENKLQVKKNNNKKKDKPKKRRVEELSVKGINA